ncbi:MAG: DUF305 domain-containing protein [Actinomycetota bacterium]|nr:DUF305 domain-containing protein [Actinomycetota bacterium]
MNRRTIALALSALLTATVLAGCATSGNGGMEGMDHNTPSPSAEANFNVADETFAMEMIGHHQQAIEMADIVLAKTGVEPQVLELAANIKAAQQPEIDLMNDWLKSWGVEMDDMGGMDHGGGMMSEEDMAALTSANGTEASALFLDQMVVHHQGAVEMAESEIENGQNADAFGLAQKIIEDQTAEIAFMQTLRAGL